MVMCNLFKVVVSGFKGTTYPDDLSGQQAMLRPLVEPIVTLVLGQEAKFEVYPRRRQLRNSTLPPCEVEFFDPIIATRFRSEAARLSRAKHTGLGLDLFQSLYYARN